MKLPHEFYQLPLAFDVKQLQKEVLALDECQWIEHPDRFKGNASIPLVSVNGEINNDFNGPMQVTQSLNDLPYHKQVIASFGEIIGRSRLMRLAPGCEVPIHSDTNYHWYKRVRIHIPIITDENVLFYCEDKHVNMEVGQAWIFDSWKYHRVHNGGNTLRVHLVIDIAGSSRFWKLLENSYVPFDVNASADFKAHFLAYDLHHRTTIHTEKFNTPLVMTPGEMDGLINDVFNDALTVKTNRGSDIKLLKEITDQLKYDWRSLWSFYGESEAGWPNYQKLRMFILKQVNTFASDFVAGNSAPIKEIFIYCILMPALNVEMAEQIK
ncbi:aspartyl/asparaginyl beta-hydroxylase domain-containing protein [Colwellia psychrerythraea]|uniref:Aspartyl/Asparaginyl beta-hydroxylase n=1 Tax=Colwellia psychrerythraea TaxID=28229 RepID=A0A099L1L0_COLPS|nr:aspartyl/asparaginyl beta-hydroxylase domain-containing protein [Colwellia psychrerythraea]KGJ96330.1 Aspartyl/Asparaginyl beta-hydroxylase [Colwellia psychrerythraea]